MPLCVLAAFVAYVFIGIVIRSAAIRYGTELFGCPVEVSRARVSLANGHVVLGPLKVSDEGGQGKSWFEAERCELEVDAAALLRRRVVVTKARMTGLRIGDPAVYGASDVANTGAARWFGDHAVAAARDQLIRFDDRFETGQLDQLESVRRTTKLAATWRDELAALHARSRALEKSAGALEESLATANANQLRHGTSLADAADRVNELRTTFENLSDDYDRLPQRLEEERRLIVAERRHDEELIRGKVRGDEMDPALLNAYLLRKQAANWLDGLMSCVSQLRRMAPTETRRGSHMSRGADVIFAGVRPQPKFLIHTLELQGKARFAGQPVDFRGELTNLTTDSANGDQPIRLHVSGSGSSPCEVRATFDRTHGKAHDELFVHWPRVRLGEERLGNVECLMLRTLPSVASLNISIAVDGEKLAGEIQIVQKDVHLTPTLAGHDAVSPIGESLQNSLGRLDSLATRVSLSGTIHEPKCALWSTLGSAVAEAMKQGYQRQADAFARDVLADAHRQVDERLAELERQTAEEREKFAVTTVGMSQRIDSIARSHTRRERMSAEQAGRPLPTTSILR
jgi:uncharacterized protein (TIGR03545 family)